jgi:hypothetical protein
MNTDLTTITDELTDAEFEIADRIELWLEARPGKLHNRSSIAKGVKAEYWEVHHVLNWMDRFVYVVAEGNGCWRKYGARRTWA